MMAEVTYELTPDPNYSTYSFPYINRYKYAAVYNLDQESFFETYDVPDIPINSKDSYHQIQAGQEGRWDLISHKYYKTVNYWWLICLANKISDPFEILPNGSIIRIPSLSYLIRGT